MTDQELHKLKFPVGEFSSPTSISQNDIDSWIDVIERFPSQMDEVTRGLSSEQLSWKYRPDGWTLKQVVHHCADSHVNAYTRFKLTVTADQSTIAPYDQDKWVTLVDGNEDDLTDSILILRGLHSKWGKFLRSMTLEDFDNAYIHPEYGKAYPLSEALPLYAWHCRHHLGHVKQALRYGREYA